MQSEACRENVKIEVKRVGKIGKRDSQGLEKIGGEESRTKANVQSQTCREKQEREANLL